MRDAGFKFNPPHKKILIAVSAAAFSIWPSRESQPILTTRHIKEQREKSQIYKSINSNENKNENMHTQNRHPKRSKL